MFKPGDMAMIIRHCGCDCYNWALGKPFRIKEITEMLTFCMGPMSRNPHMNGAPRKILIAETPEPGFKWAPADWCMRIDPSRELVGLECGDVRIPRGPEERLITSSISPHQAVTCKW
jgi:hypothetical protein